MMSAIMPCPVFWPVLQARPAPMQNLRGRCAFRLASVCDCVSIEATRQGMSSVRRALKRAVSEYSIAGPIHRHGGARSVAYPPLGAEDRQDETGRGSMSELEYWT